ncbi:YbhB/YbcL family Raf kinase inhibitor-like protein [Streptomyces sp. RFCAC02]|uniref:YbhB/YbcL family Raf kinase inhibitor-like protein n=1 Tax=Streptomyces sp. RFCAC02 TaxID=2499143 RepID=UPI00320AD89C
MELRSTAFDDRAPVPERHARGGGNVSPPLDWSRPPPGTRALALLCEDPDAPGGTFLHWLVTDIDPTSAGTAAGELPDGGSAHPNGFGDRGWDGPQPPPGDPAHRYEFRLYALPADVTLPDDVSAAEARRVLDARGLASGTLTGTYQR